MMIIILIAKRWAYMQDLPKGDIFWFRRIAFREATLLLGGLWVFFLKKLKTICCNLEHV